MFVGYGIVAPEYGWDDYKGVDVRGKTIVMLVNDPPVPDPKDPKKLDDAVFKGRAMTYYGRWTYKYEIAAEKGAAAALIVHQDGPAGYPWSVVDKSWSREVFDIESPDGNRGARSRDGSRSRRRRSSARRAGRTSARSKPPPRRRVRAGSARGEGDLPRRHRDPQGRVEERRRELEARMPRCGRDRDLQRALGPPRKERRPGRRRDLQRRRRQRVGDGRPPRDRGVLRARTPPETLRALPVRDVRGKGPPRLEVVRDPPALPAREDARRRQHGLLEYMGADERHHLGRLRTVDARRAARRCRGKAGRTVKTDPQPEKGAYYRPTTSSSQRSASRHSTPTAAST